MIDDALVRVARDGGDALGGYVGGLADRKAFSVTDPASEQWAARELVVVAALRSEAEGRRKERLAKIRELERLIRDDYDPHVRELQTIERALRDALASYAASKAADATAQLQAATTPEQVSQAVAVVVSQPDEIRTSKRWAYKIKDPDKIPRAYCRPAAGLLLAAVRAGVRSIPGVEIFQETVITRTGL